MTMHVIRPFAILSMTALIFVLTGAGHAQNESKNTPKEMTNSVGMKLVLIPSGEFLMGSPDTEKDRHDDEGPQHKVKITKAFYMGAMEVTQAQWAALMNKNPSFQKGDTLPVDQITWEAAQDFLRKLSKTEGKTYRLPTEAEWEYACRAGSITRFHFGDDETKLRDHATFKEQLHGKFAPVAAKKPNAWGLYDMHGNVWEWCSDWYGPYSNDDVVDPAGPAKGVVRVLRGGSAGATPSMCRSSLRGGLVIEGLRRGWNASGVGIRAVTSADAAPAPKSSAVEPSEVPPEFAKAIDAAMQLPVGEERLKAFVTVGIARVAKRTDPGHVMGIQIEAGTFSAKPNSPGADEGELCPWQGDGRQGRGRLVYQSQVQCR